MAVDYTFGPLVPLSRVVPTLALAAIFAACVSPVRIKTVAAPEAPVAPPLGEGLSESSLQTLRLLGLEERLESHPVEVVAVLHGLGRHGPDGGGLAVVEAEMLSLLAHATEGRDAERAADLHLLTVVRAWEFLFGGRPDDPARAFDPRVHRARELYNHALGSYLLYLKTSGRGLVGHERETMFGTYRVRIAGGGEGVDPASCEDLLVSRAVEVRGLRNRYRRDGLGAALVTFRENAGGGPLDRFLPPEGIVGAATALLRVEPRSGPSAEPVELTLSFYDPRRAETVEQGGLEVPLDADLTTPFAYLASLTDHGRLALQGLLVPGREPREGLSLLEPYDPGKIPVVMIHGLRSSPLAWMELTNDLAGHPELGRRYQIWHYAYPTGLPYLFSGLTLRRALEEVRAALDPEGDDPASAGIVVVAHSMGGLLARTLISDSGLTLWNAAFRVPPGALAGSAADIAWLEEMFVFKPLPFVRRVVFISTPHRGSATAEGIIGRLSASLVELPEEALLDRVRRLLEPNREAVQPDLLKILEKGRMTSIRALRPDSPILAALNTIPIARGVRYHTILGDRGRGDADPVSDGFVTLESARLGGAASERLVPSGHAAYAHPAAIFEIQRILREHLAEIELAGSSAAQE